MQNSTTVTLYVDTQIGTFSSLPKVQLYVNTDIPSKYLSAVDTQIGTFISLPKVQLYVNTDIPSKYLSAVDSDTE